MPYATPTAAELKLRYAAFAAVDDAVVDYWIADALRGVDTSWIESDYAPALMALAAHRMVENSVAGLAGGAVAGLAGTGLTSFKSGTFSANFSEAAATQAAEGGFESTRYGKEYLALLDRSKGGPRVTTQGVIPCRAGLIPPYSC
jgi:hypothetical protein